MCTACTPGPCSGGLAEPADRLLGWGKTAVSSLPLTHALPITHQATLLLQTLPWLPSTRGRAQALGWPSEGPPHSSDLRPHPAGHSPLLSLPPPLPASLKDPHLSNTRQVRLWVLPQGTLICFPPAAGPSRPGGHSLPRHPALPCKRQRPQVALAPRSLSVLQLQM